MPYNYNVSPAPTSGQGRYGAVPGQVTLPRPAADLGNQVPGLNRLNSALSGDIMAGLEGQLAPGTLNALQDFNAAWSVGAGMPATRGGTLSTNRLGRNIGLTAEQLKNTAIGQYNQTIPTISRTQTVNPETQIGLAEQNAVNRAAPDPTAAGSHAEDLYNQYLSTLSRGRGGAGTAGPTFPRPNPSAGPAAADSMGEVVAYGPGGGRGGSAGGGAGTAPTFAGSSSPGPDPWMDRFNQDWQASEQQSQTYGGLSADELGQLGLSPQDFQDLGLTAEDLSMF